MDMIELCTLCTSTSETKNVKKGKKMKIWWKFDQFKSYAHSYAHKILPKKIYKIWTWLSYAHYAHRPLKQKMSKKVKKWKFDENLTNLKVMHIVMHIKFCQKRYIKYGHDWVMHIMHTIIIINIKIENYHLKKFYFFIDII